MHNCCRPYYGFWKFTGDCFMTGLTGGLWLIWVLIRHQNNKSRCCHHA